MKTIIMKCSLLLLLCLPVFVKASTECEVAERRINREFSTHADANLEIDNKYGSINIVSGPAGKIVFDVLITATCSNLIKAKEAIDRVNIRFQETSTKVSAVTEISSPSGLMSWFDTGNVEIEVNYQVSVPPDVYMALSQKYGNIYVETTNRDLQVNLSYGDIRLGDINAKLNLDMAYSDGSISKINKGNFVLSYANLQMEDAEALDVDMKYTDLVTGNVSRANVTTAYCDLKAMEIGAMTYRGKYDDVVIDRITSLDWESAYTGLQIGSVTSSARFDMRYGDLQVRHVAAGFTRMDINTSYTGVILEFADNASFTIDAAVNYCDIHHRDIRVTEDIQKGSSSTLKGSKGSGGGQVYVRMNYGEFSLE